MEAIRIARIKIRIVKHFLRLGDLGFDALDLARQPIEVALILVGEFARNGSSLVASVGGAD
jgi:hypothetical protein